MLEKLKQKASDLRRWVVDACHIARIIWDGFVSFRSWLKLPPLDKIAMDDAEAEQDAARLLHWWGWNAYELQAAWRAYRLGFHYRKNIGSEHARLDPQRAYKMYSYLIVLVGWWMLWLGVSIGALAMWVLQ